jgi:hypothetical protein
MMTMASTTTRYFLTYSGRGLPLQLLEEMPVTALRNRNTWFEAEYDEAGRMISVTKMVYGDEELRHLYTYGAGGALVSALISMGDEAPQRVEVAHS